ncbi:MAG TPA: AMP-binding protein [Amycolatopsis sp.]|nr:AMP-binding protein [Amycolatopsis sp.]
MDENLVTLLEAEADRSGDRTAVIHGETRRSWRDLDARAARLAGLLASRGVGEGSRVGVALFNGPEYLETVLAVMKIRAMPVNVNYRYREGELLDLLGDAEAEALVFDASIEERVTAVEDRLPGLKTLVRLGSSPGTALDYEQAIRETPPMPRITRSGSDSWLMFTGGTTGRPKGVVSTHRWLVGAVGYNTRGMAGAITLVAPPLMHATGLYLSFGCLLGGGTVAYLPSRSYDPAELAREIERLRVTCLVVVGDVFTMPLAEALERGSYDVRSLKRMVSVGVTWSAEVKARLLDHCDAVLEDMVAASEGGPFAKSVTTREHQFVTSRFELLPGCRVIDDDGHDVVPGSGNVGLLAAPAAEETHYLGDPEKSAQTFRMVGDTRYVFTGDLATLAEDGSLVLLGRNSRVINTGGEKVFAEEVEQVIARHPGVEDVTVIGMPDPRWGHRIVAVVARRAGAELDARTVSDHVATVLAGYKRPRRVVFVPEIRRSPSGKINLAWARHVAQDEEARQAAFGS